MKALAESCVCAARVAAASGTCEPTRLIRQVVREWRRAERIHAFIGYWLLHLSGDHQPEADSGQNRPAGTCRVTRGSRDDYPHRYAAIRSLRSFTLEG